MTTASIIGGSGYTGGELLRLLLSHPNAQVQQVTSASNAGKFVHSAHPNLRKRTALQFTSPDTLKPCDVLFLCMHHGESMKQIRVLEHSATKVIDLSADFRLKSAEEYQRWYHAEHEAPEYLGRFVYGISELHREDIRNASLVSGAGCIATCAILSLAPLFREGVVEPHVIIDAKVGSSAAGASFSLATHHPERSHTVRSFQPTGHRHTGEILQELSFGETPQVALAPHAIELVRGILTTSYLTLRQDMEEKDIWKLYRKAYGEEPFMRIIKENAGVYRYPEPKLLIGTNYCDVGFEIDADSRRLVVMGAIDNLVKGAAGQAVQAMNLMCGFPETTGLDFPGLHPV